MNEQYYVTISAFTLIEAATKDEAYNTALIKFFSGQVVPLNIEVVKVVDMEQKENN